VNQRIGIQFPDPKATSSRFPLAVSPMSSKVLFNGSGGCIMKGDAYPSAHIDSPIRIENVEIFRQPSDVQMPIGFHVSGLTNAHITSQGSAIFYSCYRRFPGDTEQRDIVSLPNLQTMERAMTLLTRDEAESRIRQPVDLFSGIPSFITPSVLLFGYITERKPRIGFAVIKNQQLMQCSELYNALDYSLGDALPCSTTQLGEGATTLYFNRRSPEGVWSGHSLLLNMDYGPPIASIKPSIEIVHADANDIPGPTSRWNGAMICSTPHEQIIFCTHDTEYYFI
jgi:hypothetical protein